MILYIFIHYDTTYMTDGNNLHFESFVSQPKSATMPKYYRLTLEIKVLNLNKQKTNKQKNKQKTKNKTKTNTNRYCAKSILKNVLQYVKTLHIHSHNGQNKIPQTIIRKYIRVTEDISKLKVNFYSLKEHSLPQAEVVSGHTLQTVLLDLN